MRNLSAAVIPSVAVPTSIVGTFAVMYLVGYNLANLSLMAFTISTVFVADDAIAMIEINSFWAGLALSFGQPIQRQLRAQPHRGFWASWHEPDESRGSRPDL